MALTMGLGLYPATPAMAQDVRIEIGLLTCELGKGEEAETGPAVSIRQTRDLRCAFRPAGDLPEETYTGTLQSAGPETTGAMIWIVKSSRGTAWTPGVLQQGYAAELSAYPGLTPMLIGETNAFIVLQTFADEQTPTGADKTLPSRLSVVVTITLRLDFAPG